MAALLGTARDAGILSKHRPSLVRAHILNLRAFSGMMGQPQPYSRRGRDAIPVVPLIIFNAGVEWCYLRSQFRSL